MKYPLIIAALCIPCLVAGCTIVDPYDHTSGELHDGAPLIQTHEEAYTIIRDADELRATIDYTFTNRVGQTVSVPSCRVPHPPSLEKLIEGAWVTVYSPVVKRCAGPPVVVQPEKTWDGTFYLYSTSRPNTIPRLEVEHVPGTYRLAWSIHRGPDPYAGPASTPAERVFSNPFTIAE